MKLLLATVNRQSTKVEIVINLKTPLPLLAAPVRCTRTCFVMRAGTRLRTGGTTLGHCKLAKIGEHIFGDSVGRGPISRMARIRPQDGALGKRRYMLQS